MYRIRLAASVTLVLGITLSGCEQHPTAPDPPTRALAPGTEAEEALARHIQGIKRILASPDARFGGNRSNGRTITPGEVVTTLEGHLARLISSRAFATRSASPQPRGSDASVSSGTLEGWTWGAVGYSLSCSETSVTAYTEGYGASLLASDTWGEAVVHNLEDGSGYMESFSFFGGDYDIDTLWAGGTFYHCYPYSSSGGTATTSHSARFPDGSAQNIYSDANW